MNETVRASMGMDVAGPPRAYLMGRGEQTSLMTPLGVVEGEVLTFLDQRDSATLRQVNRHLRWPMVMVTMAVGALIRAGLVRGVQHDLEVVLKPRKPLSGFP